MLRLLTLSAATGVTALSVTPQLGGVQITPLVDGRIEAQASPVLLSSLWEPRGAVVFAVRRPG